MSWVWEHSRARLNDRLVLLAIADQARDDGTDAWPSVPRLAAKAHVSERTVQRSIRALAELGEIEIVEGGGRHRPNQYRVVMTIQTASESQGNQPVNPDTTVTVSDTDTPSDCHPSDCHPFPETPSTTAETPSNPAGNGDTGVTRTIHNPSKKPSSSEPSRLDVERLCTHLADRIERNGSKRPTVGKGWRTAARLLLDADKRTEQQVHNAIDWCQESEFWRGNILSMPKLREKYDALRLAAQRPTTPPRAEPRRPGRFAHYQASTDW